MTVYNFTSIADLLIKSGYSPQFSSSEDSTTTITANRFNRVLLAIKVIRLKMLGLSTETNYKSNVNTVKSSDYTELQSYIETINNYSHTPSTSRVYCYERNHADYSNTGNTKWHSTLPLVPVAPARNELITTQTEENLEKNLLKLSTPCQVNNSMFSGKTSVGFQCKCYRVTDDCYFNMVRTCFLQWTGTDKCECEANLNRLYSNDHCVSENTITPTSGNGCWCNHVCQEFNDKHYDVKQYASPGYTSGYPVTSCSHSPFGATYHRAIES